MTFSEFWWNLYRFFQKPLVSEYRQGYYHSKLHQSIDGYKKHLKLLKHLNKHDVIHSNKVEHICYHANIALGESFSSAIKKLNRPRYYIRKGNFRILFYKQKIGGYNARMELHFYKNKFSYYEIRFSNLPSEERNKIILFLDKKYLGNTLPFNPINNVIMDKNMNVLSVENSMDFVIHYFSSNSEIMNNAFKIEQERKTKKMQKAQFKRHQLAAFL